MWMVVKLLWALTGVSVAVLLGWIWYHSRSPDRGQWRFSFFHPVLAAGRGGSGWDMLVWVGLVVALAQAVIQTSIAVIVEAGLMARVSEAIRLFLAFLGTLWMLGALRMLMLPWLDQRELRPAEFLLRTCLGSALFAIGVVGLGLAHRRWGPAALLCLPLLSGVLGLGFGAVLCNYDPILTRLRRLVMKDEGLRLFTAACLVVLGYVIQAVLDSGWPSAAVAATVCACVTVVHKNTRKFRRGGVLLDDIHWGGDGGPEGRAGNWQYTRRHGWRSLSQRKRCRRWHRFFWVRCNDDFDEGLQERLE